MFTHNGRTGHGLGTPARKGAAIGAAFAVGAGFALAAPMSASAEEVATSYAHAQFLSGSLLGNDLADFVALEGAQAYNDGTQDKVTSKDPLHVTALSAIDLDVPGGVQTELTEYVDAGAVNQYAEAGKGGQSYAAAGAIGDDGGIGAGPVGSGAAGDVDVDLNGLLSDYQDVITNSGLSLEAVAASAAGNMDVATGDYRLAGAKLTFTSPAIADLTSKVLASLGVVDDDLGSLTGSDGLIGLDLSGVIGALGLVAEPSVSVAITTDLEAAVRPLLVGQYGEGGVRFSLESGAVEIDLESLVGDLNNLPPNTELLSDAVINPVLKGITSTIDGLIDTIIQRVDETLRQAQLDIDVDLATTTPQMGTEQVCDDILIPVVGPVGATVDDVLNGLVGGTIGGVTNGLPLGQVLPGVGGLLGDLLGGSTTPITQPTEIVGYLTDTVCEVVNRVVGLLDTSVTLDVHGTLQQILNGGAGTSSASVTALGVPITLDLDGILDGLATDITGALFDNDGAVQQVLDALNLNLLDPAVDGLLGADGLNIALTDVLSIKVNVQETWMAKAGFGMAVAQSGRMFTETAVRVSALGTAAVVNVAAATVGPNINRVVDPEDPDCTVNCGPGGPGGPGSAASGTGSLAMTGVGIATLVAVILALLAAGAYLAREGYRRNHPQAL